MAEVKKRRAPALKFKPVIGSRPAEEISAQIRERLSTRALQVGDKLPSERDLSSQFGVSRNTVRQALHSLTDMGLLEMRKGATGGAFITEGGSNAVLSAFTDLFHLGTIQPLDLTEVRLLIGVEVARLACQRGSDEEIESLAANVAEAEAAVRAGNLQRRLEINIEFHRMLARMTHNPILITLTNAVSAVTMQFVKQVGATSSRTVMPLRRRLLADLRARDAEAAAQAMREHLLRQHRLYLKEASALPRYHTGS